MKPASSVDPSRSSNVAIAFRILVTIALLLLVGVLFGVRAYGEIYSGFSPHPRRHNQGPGELLILLSLIPAVISVWWPHRALLIAAAVLLIPLTLISAVLLIIPPLGVVALLPPVLWYIYFFRAVRPDGSTKMI